MFAETAGRPLGLHFSADGGLIVCDAYKGLLLVDRSGAIESLVSEVDGVPLVFTDDVDIARLTGKSTLLTLQVYGIRQTT